MQIRNCLIFSILVVTFVPEWDHILNKIVHDKQFNVIMQGQNKRLLSHIKEKDFWHFWIIWTQKSNER